MNTNKMNDILNQMPASLSGITHDYSNDGRGLS